MQSNMEELTAELIGLPRGDRLELVRLLLFLDNRSSDTVDHEALWQKEITDRVSAVEKGRATGIDYDEALREIEKRFFQ